jgi:predicted ATPase/class 3 adenylate cyclase
MGDLPTGTVTFLFTDIEGSTRLLAELGDAYEGVLAEHRRILREAFTRHGGFEVDTQGDGFFVAFRRASDAVAAARDAQNALAGKPVRVRMGLHTGEPRVTGEGYVGMDVHRAARIGAAGHGGQVLLSEVTRALVDGGLDVQDLGQHRLKDLAEPIRLFQLGRAEFPPLRSLSQARLPLDVDPLVGRKKELGDLLRLLGRERCRLVTITGAGGVGKTRLAVAVAAELVESFEDGVTLVELAAIREPELVLPTIADTLGAEAGIAAHLGAREHLLVLDNLEQVIEAAPQLSDLLSECPGVALLTTSREPLRVAGEREFPLRPLPEAPAVELFRRRAEAVVPDFDADYAEIVEICRRLDSLPLAIELAAARIKVLPAAELLERLEQRLPILTGARRDAPERQQTLRRTIEWSHDLLPAKEQTLFARLAVFAGGFTLDAAETVCDATLDTLQSLVEKSLVRRDDRRFSMLETIREYAIERLAESGEHDQLRRRHGEHFVALAEGAQREHLGARQARWFERFRAEWDNVRAALAWSLESGEPELGLRLAGSLGLVWLDQNLLAEGERWFHALLEAPGSVDERVRARALFSWCLVATVRNENERATELGNKALEYFRRAGDKTGIAWTLSTLATIPIEHGEPETAGPMLAEAEALHREEGDAGGLRRTLHIQGQQAAAVGDVERGRRLLRESGELSRHAGDIFSWASSLHALGDTELAAGDAEAAVGNYAEALRLGWETGAQRIVCYSLAGLAAVAGARGDSDGAALLWGFVEAYEERLQFRLRKRVLYEKHVDQAAATVDERYQAGRSLEAAAAVDYGLGLTLSRS